MKLRLKYNRRNKQWLVVEMSDHGRVMDVLARYATYKDAYQVLSSLERSADPRLALLSPFGPKQV